jgi:hypothetical protein
MCYKAPVAAQAIGGFFIAMATIGRLINNLNSVSINTVVRDTLASNQDGLVAAQQKQMLQGKNSAGAIIGKYKNKKYRALKFNMNPLAGYGNVDLRLKGEFQRNIKVYFFSTSFFFKSTDSKYERLTEKYGEIIWGLNKKTTQEVSKKTIAPSARTAITKLILR